MPRKKLRRFAELETFPNVIQEPLEIVPHWHYRYFGNRNPITLETACGKGEYTIGLARRYPQRNFIGIDRKGGRIWRGAKIALEENLKNAMFIRADAGKIADLFAERAVSEIWITFPDPYPNNAKASKRLTSPNFLNLYRRIIKPNGVIHLKTDDNNLFGYTLETLRAEKCIVYMITLDLYGDEGGDDILNLKTTYERKHLMAGRKIKYLRFGFGPYRRQFPKMPAAIEN